MNLCRPCKGIGFIGNDFCEVCDGEGILEQQATVEKIIKKKPIGFNDHQDKINKTIKFDKKNATRG